MNYITITAPTTENLNFHNSIAIVMCSYLIVKEGGAWPGFHQLVITGRRVVFPVVFCIVVHVFLLLHLILGCNYLI